MEKTIINKYKAEFCGGTIIVERGNLSSNEIPARLAGSFISTDVTIDWVYKFDTDTFVSETRRSINKDNSYVIDKIEENVCNIALEILNDNNIDIQAIQQAILDKKEAMLEARAALEIESMSKQIEPIEDIDLENITPIAEA